MILYYSQSCTKYYSEKKFYFIFRVSFLSPRHDASSGCGRKNGLRYGG